MKNKGISKIQLYFLFLIFVTLTYISLNQMILLSYLNDEWIQYALVQLHGWTAELFKFSWLGIVLGPARPLGTIVNNLFFLYFPFQAWPFFLWALIFHPINGLLSYLLVYKLSKNIRISLISALFFVTSSVSYQTFSWLAATVQGVASTTFILLTLYLFILFIERFKKRFLLGTVLSLYIAVLFKDSSFFVLLVLPILFMLFNKKSISKKLIFLIIFPLLCIIGAFGIYRVALSMTGFEHKLVQLGTNVIMYPFISLPHFFIPYRFMYRVAGTFEQFIYPALMPILSKENISLVAYTMVSDIISILISIIGICVVYVAYIKIVVDRKIILFAVLFYILCFLPIAFYLDHRNASYVESRYLYIINFPVGILFACVIEFIINRIRALKPYWFYGGLFLIYVSLGVFFVKNMQISQREIMDSVKQGEILMQTITAMKNQWPVLPDKAIVYLEGDRFFYHPTLKVPFQLGPGFMMMVLYYKTGKIPRELIDTWYLLSVTEEGYKEVRNQGFGYFYEMSSLKRLFTDNSSVVLQQIVAMRYDSNTEKFIDITEQTRKKIISR